MKKAVSGLGFWKIALCVWLVFSAAYIVHDLWKNGLSATYQAGYQRAFSDVLVQSQACQPFNVFVGEAKADLINLKCLEAPEGEGAAAQGAEAATEEAPANPES